MYRGINRSPAEVIIFSLITCGIYYLYWLYKFATEIKFYLSDERYNPGVELLLCILCFPYQLYWFYKYGKALADANLRAGLPPEDNSILYLILAVLGLGIVSAAIMQSNANRIWNET